MKLNKDEFLYISALEEASSVVAKDCITRNGMLTFLIHSKDMGKAIGREGKTIKELSKKMNKKIEVIAYYDDLKSFLENALKTSVQKIDLSEGSAVVKINSTDKRSVMSNRHRLNIVKEILERNYEIKDLKIR